jgi:hypothetical protein
MVENARQQARKTGEKSGRIAEIPVIKEDA